MLLADRLDGSLHLRLGRREHLALLDLELALELVDLALDLVLELGQLHLLLEERVVGEDVLLALQLLGELVALLHHRLDLAARLAVRARDRLAGGLALGGGDGRLLDVPDADLDGVPGARPHRHGEQQDDCDERETDLAVHADLLERCEAPAQKPCPPTENSNANESSTLSLSIGKPMNAC